MTLTDFSIQIYDRVPRKYRPRHKKRDLNSPERTMFSFTLSWRGLIDGADPINPLNYLGSEHKGCMFYAAGGDKLGWGYPKTTTFKGHQIIPSTPNGGLYDVVLSYLEKLPEAEVIREEIRNYRASIIPDPETPPEPQDRVVIA